MASVPFAKRGRSRANNWQLSTTDETKLPREKELVYQNSSGIGSYTSGAKSRSKKPRIVSENTSTSDGPNGTSYSSPKPRRVKPQHDAIIAISFRKGKYRYGSVEEREPLVKHDKEDSRFQDDVVVNIPGKENEQASCTNASLHAERFWSVILFLLLLMTALALLISVNVKSDSAVREINPLVFHYYTVALIIVFIIWLAVELLQYHQRGQGKEYEPLVPRHLLNGLALFGTCNTGLQVIEIVDFFKCSQHVPGLDKSYVVVASFEMVFVYCQIYFFYTLSRKRKQNLWFGSSFTMFSLAVNLTLWASYFCAGAVNHPDLRNVSWLHRYYYGIGEDVCTFNNTGYQSRTLHAFVNTIVQYKFTFAMEYSLLASALLLHLWVEIARPTARPVNRSWVVWRFGFFAGLFILPFIGTIIVYTTVEFEGAAIAFCVLQCAFFFLIMVCSVRGLHLLKSCYRRVSSKTSGMTSIKVDIILLSFSSIGFVIIDSFTIFAAFCIVLKSHADRTDIVLSGFTAFLELLSIFSLTIFIFASYFYQNCVDERGSKAAKRIRQIGSFCLIMSFGLWIMRTFTFRSDHYFDIAGRTYFGQTTWFAVTQLSVPLCIFFHFHCAVCLSEIIADST